MRKTFPRKKKGDRLGADHVNGLSEICEFVAKGNRGPNVDAFDGSFGSLRVAGRLRFEILYITEDNGDGTYAVKRKFYNHVADSPGDTVGWQVQNQDQNYILDGSQSGSTFGVGTTVLALWHAQRLAFLPLTSSGTMLKIGKAADIIPADNFGPVKLWVHGSNGVLQETDETLEVVWHDWVTGNQDIEEGDEVIIGYFPDDYDADGNQGTWRIIGAECPP